jgi:hypothetical protein
MKVNVLASGLDIMYADRIYYINKRSVMIYSKSIDEQVVQNQLNQWAEKGHIQILKPLVDCEDMESCIKLLNWIQPRP